MTEKSSSCFREDTFLTVLEKLKIYRGPALTPETLFDGLVDEGLLYRPEGEQWQF